MKKLLTPLLMAIAATAALAEPVRLNTLSDAQLTTRWNKQAEGYDKAFLLGGCTETKVPNSKNSFTLCSTADDVGAVFFRRKAGALENVEYMIAGHPLRGASMFLRFVRGSGSGNMAELGGRLLKNAKAQGQACEAEPSAQICAYSRQGKFEMSAQ